MNDNQKQELYFCIVIAVIMLIEAIHNATLIP